jgi:hypothetical protein
MLMADNLIKRGALDRLRVNVNEGYDLKYWSHKWNVTYEELRDAVKQVGPAAEKVAKYLGKPID